MRRLACLLGLATALLAGGAQAEAVREVHGARVELGELAAEAPQELRGIDVCRSPRPGTSMLLTREDILREVTQAGFDATRVNLPAVLRIVNRGARRSPLELAALLTPSISGALPKGVELQSVSVQSSLILPEDLSILVAKLGDIPKRPGSQRIGLSADVLSEGELYLRLPVTVVVRRSAQALKSTITRGSTLTLVWERNGARIEVEGTALSDADVGDVANFRVKLSNKTLKARVLSEKFAKISEGS